MGAPDGDGVQCARFVAVDAHPAHAALASRLADWRKRQTDAVAERPEGAS